MDKTLLSKITNLLVFLIIIAFSIFGDLKNLEDAIFAAGLAFVVTYLFLKEVAKS